MEIRISRITPKPFGVNFNLPGKEFPTIGALAPEFPEGLSGTSILIGKTVKPSLNPASRST